MKSKVFILISIILLLCSCSSDDNGDGTINKDELLTGTTWYYSDDFISPITNHNEKFGHFQVFQRYLVIGEAVNSYTTEDASYTEADTTSFSRNPKKIIFGNSTCQLIDSTFTSVNITHRTYDCTKYQFKPGTYHTEAVDFTVTNDNIHVVEWYDNFDIPLDNGAFYMPKDFSKYTSSHEISNKNVNVNSVTYDFTRTLYDVTLSQGNIKYQGKINADEGTLTLKQYSPSVGEEFIFDIIK